jgi:hypothetical protein
MGPFTVLFGFPAMVDSPPEASRLQATLVDFALGELVRQHRDRFQPLWTAESWAKLLIWLALNCGCGADGADLQRFAEALGPALAARLRRQYYQRELEDLDLQVLADPAEPQVLVLPLGPDPAALRADRIAAALERVGLAPRVVLEQECWGRLERAVVIPWRPQP